MLARYKITSIVTVIIVFVSVAIISCAQLKHQTQNISEPKIIDTTNIYNLKLEKDYWKLIEEPPTEFPSLIHDLELSGCLFLKFVIDAEGRATNFETIVSYGSDIAKEAFIKSVGSWRWLKVTPTAVPIKTSRIFSVGQDTALREKCYL